VRKMRKCAWRAYRGRRSRRRWRRRRSLLSEASQSSRLLRRSVMLIYAADVTARPHQRQSPHQGRHCSLPASRTTSRRESTLFVTSPSVSCTMSGWLCNTDSHSDRVFCFGTVVERRVCPSRAQDRVRELCVTTLHRSDVKFTVKYSL